MKVTRINLKLDDGREIELSDVYTNGRDLEDGVHIETGVDLETGAELDRSELDSIGELYLEAIWNEVLATADTDRYFEECDYAYDSRNE